MPRPITYREQSIWEQIATNTYAMQLPHGLLIRYDTPPAGEIDNGRSVVVYAPDESIDDVAPWVEEQVCADGDPPCGDPDCERTHAEPSA